jgi:uncharacterized protein YsxB (DUF464 family)
MIFGEHCSKDMHIVQRMLDTDGFPPALINSEGTDVVCSSINTACRRCVKVMLVMGRGAVRKDSDVEIPMSKAIKISRLCNDRSDLFDERQIGCHARD